MSRGTSGAASSPRRRSLVVLAVAAMVVVPAAIAWACNPQAHIRVDRSSYGPGQAMSVSGIYFRGSEAVTVTIQGGGTAQATTSSGGSFRVSMSAPSSPGAYTVYASHTSGRAVASFRVAEPTAEQPAAEQPAPQQPAQGPSQETQRPSPTSEDTAVARSRGERTTVRSESGPRPRTGERGSAPTGGSGGGVVTTGSGQAVFADTSPSPAGAPAAFAPAGEAQASGPGERRRSRGAREGAAPSEQSAVSGAWGAAVPGRTPTLTNGVADVSDGGAGSQLGIGLALLGFGVAGLLGGLTAAELRRRRAIAGR